MDLVWIILGSSILVIGIVGCIVPIIPGPLLSYASLLILQLRQDAPFTARFLAIWALVTALVTLLDYVVPVWGTKKLGGTKRGVWGATIGLILGLFFPPAGIIIGPFVGAFIGELTGGKDSGIAFKSALGSFLGFVAGTMLKLVFSFVIAYHFIVSIF